MKIATPSLARAINDRVALDLLLAHGPLSAPRLRELTGLSRPTVSDLLERLGEAGLVREAGEEGAARRGPNAKLYALVADHAHVAGVDVRFDAVTAVVADLTGRHISTARRAMTDGVPLQRTIRQATGDAARRAGLALGELHNLVIGAPGLVDPATGDLEFPGLPVIPLPELAELIGVPVVIENEVNLAAIAELHTGTARDHTDFVLMWIDHGLGGAVVMDGRLRRGASGGAGEFCQLRLGVDETGPYDPDRYGYPDIISAGALRDLAARHGVPGDRPGEILDAAIASDATAFLDDLATGIAVTAAAPVCVVDPGLVILAGETGRHGGSALAARVEARLNGMLPVTTAVRATELSDNPVLGGAVRTALEVAHQDVFGGGRP